MNTQGDPRLSLGPDGSWLNFSGGQPAMDRGLENLAFISLFTSPGWCGNGLLTTPIGSDFEIECSKPITRSSLNRIRNAAERALSDPLFGRVEATVSNPSGNRLDVVIRIERGGLTLTLSRSNSAWYWQGAQVRPPKTPHRRYGEFFTTNDTVNPFYAADGPFLVRI